jgi:chemotaxis protein methyltransferase CheR
MKPNRDIEKVEIDLLLEAVFKKYGYDFRNYARASIERRIRQFLPKSGCSTIMKMIERLLKDEEFFGKLVREFSITVTELFRDPHVYASIRENVIPVLKTHPFVKIWHAGCATGEEAYSLAIVLKEEGLYDRSTIFVTDFNDAALEKAKLGIYPIDKIQEATRNYIAAGGNTSFSEYYQARYNSVSMSRDLRKNMTFANYNLVTDGIFSEIHFILCRNVLIYFDRDLQNRVFELFSGSLVRDGFLCLGTKETPNFSTVRDHFDAIDRKAKIYKKLP